MILQKNLCLNLQNKSKMFTQIVTENKYNSVQFNDFAML